MSSKYSFTSVPLVCRRARRLRRGTSLLLVEQDVTRALELADMVYLMNRGRIVFSRPAAGQRGEDVLECSLGIDVTS
jgi:ABC-type branched-subunit amino acid transport system ATPase component